MSNPVLMMDRMLAHHFPPLFPAQIVSAHRHVINLSPQATPDFLFSFTDNTVPLSPRQLRSSELAEANVEKLAAQFSRSTPTYFDCHLRLPATAFDDAKLEMAWQTLIAASVNQSDDFSRVMQKRLHQGIDTLLSALENAQDILPVADLLGLGIGLTPSGDDFLCGLLIALHLPISPFAKQLPILRRNICRDIAQTHLLSAAFLRDATNAQVSKPVQDMIDALHGNGSITMALTHLTQLGHSSGFDILSGLLAGLPHPKHRRIHLCPFIAV